MTIDIYDRENWRGGAPHAAFAELRRTDPVHWQEIPGQAGYWAVLRHADVVAVSRQPAIYSAEQGGILLEDLDEEPLTQLRSMLLAMDPPKHQRHRRPLTVPFGKPAIATLEKRVRDICRDILAGVPEVSADGTPVDLVHDVASPLPTRVLGEVLGLPEEDWDHLHEKAALSARTIGESADHEGIAAVSALAVYAMEHAARRRAEPPRDDVTSLMLAAEVNGKPMDDLEFALQFVQLFIAGNDTTVGMLANGLDVLLDHPDQLALLRAAEPSERADLFAGAVEEIVRYAGPLHYFRRTATVDTELGGKQIKAGDKVGLYYVSANRDETVFTDPDTFDVRRGASKHVAFGFGEHYCLGVHLARLEGRVFFEELLSTFGSIERAGDPVKIHSNFNNGLDLLPVRLTR